MVVPGEGADAGGVAGHGAETAGFLRIVDLHEAFVGADGDVAAALDPGYGGDEVVVLEFAEFGHFAAGGVPHVDTGAEADAEDVSGAPVDEVEVEVVGEFGGVEDFVGDFGDGAGLFARRLQDGL